MQPRRAQIDGPRAVERNLSSGPVHKGHCVECSEAANDTNSRPAGSLNIQNTCVQVPVLGLDGMTWKKKQLRSTLRYIYEYISRTTHTHSRISRKALDIWCNEFLLF